MNTKAYHFQMAVKTVEDDSQGGVTIEGFASTPDVDRYRDIVEPAAFKSALQMYMKNPVLLRSHDADRPVGSVVGATVTDKGLKIVGKITDPKTVTEIKDGRMRAMSIGYIPLSTELQHEDGSEFNFEEDSVWDPSLVRVIKALDLIEISIVATPANGNALFTMSKSIQKAVNEVAYKNLNLNIDSMEKKTTETEEITTDEVVDGATDAEETTETAATDEVEEETTETEDTAAEGTTEESKEAPEETDSEVEEAENSDENSEAATAEGVETTEEAATDAEPQEDEEETEATEDAEAEEKALVLEAKDLKDLAMFKKVGLARAKGDDEEATSLSPEVKHTLKMAADAIAYAAQMNDDLTAKLDGYAEKKALAPHSQLDGEEEVTEVKKNEPKTVSKGFAMLFGGK